MEPTPEPERIPAAKATRAEMAERIAFSRELIGQGKRDGEIKRAMCKEFGIRPRTASKYIAKARQRIREDLGKTRTELQCESLEFYQAIVSDSKAPIQARLRARAQMDRIMGLNNGFYLTGETEAPTTDEQPTQADRMAIFNESKYLEFLRQEAVKEDAEDGDTIEDQSDGDTNPVWEDGDTGTTATGEVA